MQDGKFLTSSGVTAGIDAGFVFMANTYVAPEDRKANPSPQIANAKGDATVIPGFSKEKALAHAHFTAFGLEYRWHSDPTDDPFVDLPTTSHIAANLPPKVEPTIDLPSRAVGVV